MGGALLLDAQLLDFAVERTLRHEEFGSRLTASAVVVFQSLDNLLALHVGLGPLARGLVGHLLALGENGRRGVVVAARGGVA